MRGLLYEILTADDLILLADSLEDLHLKFDVWKEAFESRGLKINMSKTRLLVSGEEGERVVSRTDPCGVCDRRVGTIQFSAKAVIDEYKRGAVV